MILMGFYRKNSWIIEQTPLIRHVLFLNVMWNSANILFRKSTVVFVYFPTLPLSYIHIGYYIFSIKLIRMSPFLLCCSEIFQSIGMSGLWWLIWWWMVDFLFWLFCVGQFHSTCLSLCHICSLHTFCYVVFFSFLACSRTYDEWRFWPLLLGCLFTPTTVTLCACQDLGIYPCWALSQREFEREDAILQDDPQHKQMPHIFA